MVDKVVSVFTTALVVAGVGISLRPGAPTDNVIKAVGSAFSQIVTATYGPR